MLIFLPIKINKKQLINIAKMIIKKLIIVQIKVSLFIHINLIYLNLIFANTKLL
jgi:hypothetical protein